LGLSATLHQTGLAGRTWPIALGQAVVTFPVVVIVVSSALARVDPDVVRAAPSLGAGWPMVAWRVELPLIRRSVAAAAFAVTIAFDELVIALFVAPPGIRTLPVALFSGTRNDLRPDSRQ